MSTEEGWEPRQAEQEGWFIFHPSEGVSSLVAFYKSDFFRGESLTIKVERLADARALAFVQQKAAEGSAYHIEALARTQLL